jgi:hypothetical protein
MAMKSRKFSMAMRLVLSLAAGAALSGCAYYGPPYAAYDAGPYTYGSPVYAGPPVLLSFGYYEHHYGGGYGYRGGHRWRGGSGWHGGPGWRGHGWGGRGWAGHGWGGHGPGGGGWRGRH